MTPAVAAARTGGALLIGMALGVLYGFLRPLRPKYTLASDGIFVLAALMGWIYLAFGICRGDPRLGHWAAAIGGGFLWEMTVGRYLGKFYRGFWRLSGKIRRLIWAPFKKFFHFFGRNAKKALHLEKNRVQ